MNVQISAGKGGVGKTNIAVALALLLAGRGQKTALIDYDGGHSVATTLGLDGLIKPNTLYKVRPNLSVAVIEEDGYKSIGETKRDGESTAKYLAQFPGDLGIIAFTDMIYEFFGVPTDISTVQKFIWLVRTMMNLEWSKFEQVVIDVEPTAGLERLLAKAPAMVRSLRNLRQNRFQLLALGVKWPDIAAFLKGPYMDDIETHLLRMQKVAKAMQDAHYYLICVPELSPIKQTFAVRQIIERAGGTVKACVLNRAMNLEHSDKRYQMLRQHQLPVIEVPEFPGLHDGHAQEALAAMGERLAGI